MNPSPALRTIQGQLKYLTLAEILWLIQELIQQVAVFLPSEVMGVQLRHAKLNGDIPTMAELWTKLDVINQENPLEMVMPERINRPDPFEMARPIP